MTKSDTLYQIAWISRPLMQAAETTVENGLSGTGLTVRMRAVLEILHHQGALTVPDLAHQLQIQRQYVQVMVNETLTAGLTERRDNPRHKRSHLLDLTEEGKSLIQDVIARELKLVQTLSQDFDENDLATTLSVMRRFTEILSQSVGQATR